MVFDGRSSSSGPIISVAWMLRLLLDSNHARSSSGLPSFDWIADGFSDRRIYHLLLIHDAVQQRDSSFRVELKTTQLSVVKVAIDINEERYLRRESLAPRQYNLHDCAHHKTRNSDTFRGGGNSTRSCRM